MLKIMNEMDEVWTRLIEEATVRAKAAGRTDVADYLELKAGNDAIRLEGVQWLFKSFLESADRADKQGIKVQIENENPHRFPIGGATMVGSLIRFRFGLRNLTVEAGWARAPGDGFMRGGALACARITHFGIAKYNAELMLARSDGSANLPRWVSIEKDGTTNPVSLNDLRRHFNFLLDSV